MHETLSLTDSPGTGADSVVACAHTTRGFGQSISDHKYSHPATKLHSTHARSLLVAFHTDLSRAHLVSILTESGAECARATANIKYAALVLHIPAEIAKTVNTVEPRHRISTMYSRDYLCIDGLRAACLRTGVSSVRQVA